MGCQQSTPADSVNNDPSYRSSSGRSVGKDGKQQQQQEQKQIKGIGATERLMSAQMKLMSSSANSSSSGQQPTVSLEADEEISNSLPKLRPDGTLMPEEIVRRTSSSLTNSSIAVGTTTKDNGKMFQLEVRVREGRISVASLMQTQPNVFECVIKLT